MPASISDQSQRLLGLLRALTSGHALDLATVARVLDRTPRTAQRTMRSLRAAGVPLEERVADLRTGRKQYALPQGGPPGVSVDVLDLLALHAVELAAAPGSAGPFVVDLERLRSRLRGALSPEQAVLYDRVAALFGQRRRATHNFRERKGAVETLLDGALRHTACEAVYAKPGQPVERYVLEPLGLFTHAGHLYCVARKRGTEAVRTFRADRFHSVVRRRDDHFAPPAGFDLQAYVTEPFGVCHGPTRRVRLRFDPELAAYAAEGTWHGEQELQSTPDGHLDVTFESQGDEEILAWAARFTDRAELLEPPELRAELARRLARAATRYGAAVDRSHRTPTSPGARNEGEGPR